MFVTVQQLVVLPGMVGVLSCPLFNCEAQFPSVRGFPDETAKE